MNETEMYAAIGRKQTELDNLNVEYDRLLGLLSSVVSGETDAKRVKVNLVARQWAVEPQQAPQEPAGD